MRKWAITGAVAGVAVGTGSAMAANMPISLSSGYNQNAVLGSGTGSYTSVTAAMDGAIFSLPGSNYQYVPPYNFSADTYYTVGYNATATTTGIPLGTSITSASNSNTTFEFQPVAATNNAIVLTNQTGASQNDTLALSSPAAYGTLAFLGVDNSGSMTYTINFQGGATQTGTLSFPSWFPAGGTPYAYQPYGRVFITGTTNPDLSTNMSGVGNFDAVGNSSGPQIFEVDLSVTDTTDPINSISLDLTGGGPSYESDAIFALSGQAVPEPISLGLISIGAAGMLMKRRRRLTEDLSENPIAAPMRSRIRK
jgi:hypothetical protein